MSHYIFRFVDVISCELDCLLNILRSQELKELQKTFKIKLSSSKSQTKPEMIKSFINLVKNQRTFCGNSTSNLKERLVKGYFIILHNLDSYKYLYFEFFLF